MTDGIDDPETGAPGISVVVLVALGLIGTLGIVDLILDTPASWLSLHVIVELAFIAVCLGTAAFLGRAWQRARRSLDRARAIGRERQAERDAWRARAETFLQGLGQAIDEQLRLWQLTPVEKETALLVLKGFSHKEIAMVTGRGERTVRQHAVAIYRKSGLAGRAELSAFFLEDLLLPAEAPPARSASIRGGDDPPGPGGSPGPVVRSLTFEPVVSVWPQGRGRYP